MKATKHIDIYLTQKRNVRTIDVVQFDTGIQLVFNVKDFSIPSDASATLYVQKPSGKFVLQEDGITISGNTITIALENQAITEHGKIPYQVGITSGTDVITTFTGLMMVEKSMKDAGATESITVIRAFDEAVSAHVEEFQTKAEQIVQACIATIPEDYTATEAKVNDSANAVKGYLSGAVVVADDVSPVEHKPLVLVRGKNLFDISKIESHSTLTNNGNGTITVAAGSYHVTTGKKLSELCPRLSVGDVCILSFENQSPTSKFFHLSITGTWFPGEARTITREMLNSSVAVYGCHPNDATYGSENVISDIQVEFGETATEYTPYIDPATVTVARHGKNLLKPSNIGGHVAYNATNDLYTISATGSRSVHTLPVPIPKGTQCTVRVEIISGKITNLEISGQAAVIGGYHVCDDGNSWQCAASFPNGEGVNLAGRVITATATVTETVTDIYFFFYASAVTVVEPIVCKVQFEIGDAATDYKAYQEEQILIPNADGAVPGITSLSPSMTILTDTEGVIVECEYNRDTNKVIEKLTNAIKALGGAI